MVQGPGRAVGGMLTLTSQPGEGTIVELRLPVASSAPAVTGPVPPPDGGVAGLILLVDDEELVRMAVADGLRDSGYTVVEAGRRRRRSNICATARRPMCWSPIT